jgi:hypothetical protein
MARRHCRLCEDIERPSNGGFALQFNDKLKAHELMAIAGGELKQPADHKHTFDYAAFVGAEPPVGDDEWRTGAAVRLQPSQVREKRLGGAHERRVDERATGDD